MRSAVHRRELLVQLIDELHARHGFAPSVRELLAASGLRSMSTIHRDLVALRDEGLIEWEPNQKRTLRVVSA